MGPVPRSVFRVLAAIPLAVAAALAVFTLMLPVDPRYAAGAAALFLGMGLGASVVLAWGFRLVGTRPMVAACIAAAVMVGIGLLASPPPAPDLRDAAGVAAVVAVLTFSVRTTRRNLAEKSPHGRVSNEESGGVR